jgi:hypothetical protein
MSVVFFSYSHKDEVLRNELETHLITLRRQGGTVTLTGLEEVGG